MPRTRTWTAAVLVTAWQLVITRPGPTTTPLAKPLRLPAASNRSTTTTLGAARSNTSSGDAPVAGRLAEKATGSSSAGRLVCRTRGREAGDTVDRVGVSGWGDNSATMLMFELIAEQRIAEAIERGELTDLPGAGRPLDLGEDPLVPEDLRLAYRILKSAGFVPPELETRREIRALEDLIHAAGPDCDTTDVLRKLRLLRLELAESGRRGAPCAQSEYFAHVVQRLR